MKTIIPFTDFGHLKAGRDKTRVHLYYLRLLNTLIVSFFGGRPHLGAVTASLKLNAKKKFSGTFRVPGHRDDVVTKKAGSILSKGISGAIVATAGIHYNGATRPQIQSIVKNSEKLSRQLVSILKS